MTKEYIIYCDESEKRGKYFSNFYGGALVRSDDIMDINTLLEERKKDLNLFGEVKFQKITKNYIDKYKALLDTFFALVADDKVKVRIMFTQNYYVANNLDTYQREQEYFLLYYQFIKHAFGLQYSNSGDNKIAVTLLLDQLPDTREKSHLFKQYLSNLSQNKQLRDAGISIPQEQIGEIKSHDHVILQCLDIVLGAVQFRLNDMHKEKLPETNRRGKRTLAKEKVYKHIHGHLCAITERKFNIGITTGLSNGKLSLWEQPYRHWLFVPRKHVIDKGSVKK